MKNQYVIYTKSAAHFHKIKQILDGSIFWKEGTTADTVRLHIGFDHEIDSSWLPFIFTKGYAKCKTIKDLVEALPDPDKHIIV